jgi:hypothetical protein
MGSAAPPNITARLLRLMSFMKILLPPEAARKILERVHIMSYADREGVVRCGKDWERPLADARGSDQSRDR